MTVHNLKSWPEYFAPVHDGIKNFELRLNDRHYHVGDVLRLQEWDDRKGVYTGRECRRKVTYMTEGIGPGAIPPLQGLHHRYVIMSLETEK